MRLSHHKTTQVKFPRLVVGNSFASPPDTWPHKTCWNVVNHCKPALHITDDLLWRTLGFATWLKTIHSAYVLGQPTSCPPPRRTLNRRCSVLISSTNSAKVLACPRKTHAELLSHPRRHLHACRCADGLVIRRLCGRHFGQHPMEQISWLTLGAKLLKLQFRYSFVLRLPAQNSINVVSAVKNLIFVLFCFCDERVFNLILCLVVLRQVDLGLISCLPHYFCMVPFSVFPFLYVFLSCSLSPSLSVSVSVYASLGSKCRGSAPIKNEVRTREVRLRDTNRYIHEREREREGGGKEKQQKYWKFGKLNVK